MRKVLDAWALMAWLQDEPAADRVQTLLDDAAAGRLRLAMNMVNVGEVYYKVAKLRGEGHAVAFLKDLRRMPIRTLEAPRALILEAARWKSRYPISYADAFAVATAAREGAPLVSGDPELKVFMKDQSVQIEWIGF